MKPYIIEETAYRGSTDVHIHSSVCFDPQADIANRLMRSLAIATVTPDGEDSSGRQKFRLLTPEEVALRACQISECAAAEFQRRDWLTPLPAPKPQKSREEL